MVRGGYWYGEIQEIDTKWTLAVEMTGERGCTVSGSGFRVYLGGKLEMTGEVAGFRV